jgi:voltage-gated potassium channel
MRIRVRHFLRQHVASTRTVAAVAASTVALVLLAGLAIRVTDPHLFRTPLDGWWWAASTITTVGYGDLVPATSVGRMVGLVLMFSGIALVSLLTASIAALLMGGDVEAEEQHLERRLDRLETLLEDLVDRLEASELEVPPDLPALPELQPLQEARR